MCKWFDLYYFEIIDENKQIGKRMDGTFICESIAKLNFNPTYKYMYLYFKNH